MVRFEGFIAEAFEHLAYCFPVLFGGFDAVACHEGVDYIGNHNVGCIEHGKLFVEESFEISFDGRNESFAAFLEEVVVTFGRHPLEGWDLDGEQSGGVGAAVALRLLPEEPGEDAMAVGSSLEFDASCERVPVVVPQPLLEVRRDVEVDVEL